MSRRMYVVSNGDKGVVFVTLNPLRVARITPDAIKKYADVHNKKPEQVFADISKAANDWIDITKQGSGSDALSENGAPASTTDYALTVDMRNDAWREDRNPFPPIRDGLNYLSKIKSGASTKIHPVTLFTAGPLQPKPKKPKPEKAKKKAKKKAGRGKRS